MTMMPAAAPNLTTDAISSDAVLGQYIPLLYHYNMLQDADRVGAFRRAIELIVQPGDHVVELGGGTGILSSFAARRGAMVTCVERNPELVACARRLIEANGLQGQIDVVQADATTYVPNRPVDAVICEMLHVGLLREKQAQVIAAFKRNYRGAFDSKLPVFLPEASILMVQPVHQSFDFDGYHAAVPMFQAPLENQPRTQELSALAPYANICYDDAIPMRHDIVLAITCNCTGEANAIRFVTQNVIAVDLPGQCAITWPNQCLVLPLAETVFLSQGDQVEIAFQYDAGDEVNVLGRSLQLKKRV